MADITWSTPHTGSVESASNIKVLWITEYIFVVCWEDAAGTGFKANVYSSDGTHLHTQALFTYGTIRDEIQLAKIRNNHWILAYTEDVGNETVRMNHFEWTGSSIIDHGYIAGLANQQSRYVAVCNIGEDKIMLWARRFDLDDTVYAKYCTFNGSTWSIGGSSSIVGSQYANSLRACTSEEDKGILVWDKRCHGFGSTPGGGANIVSIEGDLIISHYSVCRLADNRIIICARINDGGLVGRIYAVTLEDLVLIHKPTVGTPFEFYSGNCTNNRCVRIDDTHFLIAYEDRDDSYKGKTRLCTVNWSTRVVTANSVEIFSSNDIGDGGAYGIGMASNSSGIIALSYRDNDDNSYVKTMVSNGVPDAPVITGTGDDSQNTTSISEVPGATKYNIYWSLTPGVTKENGTKIEDVIRPYEHTDLIKQNYYYVVTAENAEFESVISNEICLKPDFDGKIFNHNDIIISRLLYQYKIKE